MKVLCRQWIPPVWNAWMSCEAAFRCRSPLLWRTSHLFAWLDLWFLSQYVEGHYPTWSAVWLELSRKYSPLHLRIHPDASVSRSSAAEQAQHITLTPSVIFSTWWAVYLLLQTFIFPSSLVSSAQRSLFRTRQDFVWMFFHYISVFECYQWLEPCCKSFIINLWDLLECVPDLPECYEKVFLHHGEDYLIFYLSYCSQLMASVSGITSPLWPGMESSSEKEPDAASTLHRMS